MVIYLHLSGPAIAVHKAIGALTLVSFDTLKWHSVLSPILPMKGNIHGGFCSQKSQRVYSIAMLCVCVCVCVSDDDGL